MKFLTRTIILLSVISLFTDLASEMLYPIMPVYLQSIGFSVLLIGILEGIAEGIAGLSKGYFGKLSDTIGQRRPFIQIGYSISALSKPMLALFSSVYWIFICRSMDRVGKGIRTAPRDAMLSAESTPQNKGKVFGFHRGMDTLGAVLGPAFALLILYFYPSQYKLIFLIAFIPGALAIISGFFIHEKQSAEKPKAYPSFLSFFNYLKNSRPDYKNALIPILLFALINSSDMFLLLKAKQSGASDLNVIVLYIIYNLIYVLLSFPMGALADKIGIKTTYAIGLLLFSLTYIGLGFCNQLSQMVIIFVIYGAFAAMNDGLAKAWISNTIPKEEAGTALGTMTAFQSICTMLSSAIACFIWIKWGSEVLFFLIGGTAIIITLIIIGLNNLKPKRILHY